MVGTHSGTSGLIERYRGMGIVMGRPEAELLLVRARNLSRRCKRALSDRELTEIYFEQGSLPKAA